MADIIKDTDQTITLTLTDSAGDPIDIATLAGIVCLVYQKNIPFDQFSLNAQAGYRAIDVTDEPNGIFNLYLNADNTHKGYLGKKVFVEIKTQVVNANFDSGTEDKSTGEIELGELTRSDLKETTFV